MLVLHVSGVRRTIGGLLRGDDQMHSWGPSDPTRRLPRMLRRTPGDDAHDDGSGGVATESASELAATIPQVRSDHSGSSTAVDIQTHSQRAVRRP